MYFILCHIWVLFLIMTCCWVKVKLTCRRVHANTNFTASQRCQESLQHTHTHTHTGGHSEQVTGAVIWTTDADSNWFSLGQLRLQDVQDSSQNSSLLLTPIPHQQVGGVSPATRPQQRLLQTLSSCSGGGAGPHLVLNTHETHIDLLSLLILCLCFIYISLNAL